MRVHQLLVRGIQDTLVSIFEGRRPADRALESTLKSHSKWGSRDRRFVAETVYDCVRWWRKLEFACGQAGIPSSIDSRLRLYGTLKGWEPVDGPFQKAAEKAWQAAERAPRAIRESVPDWIDELGAELMGESVWERELHALNDKAPVDLRVNVLKADVEKVRAALREEGIEVLPIKNIPSGLTLAERKNVFVTQAFKKGWFEVQDRSSQRVGPFLDPQPGERIVDACAGSGGKSLHLAALMQNRGKILALDIHQWKLDELRKRASRDGVGTIETRLVESRKVIKRLKDSADRLLLDVPCTGFGVLRRNPDTKWKLLPEDYARVLALQKDLLESYCSIVKPGGVVVYSTCSLLPSENLQQVEGFCSTFKDEYVLEEHWSARPSEQNGDGFFAARLRRHKKN